MLHLLAHAILLGALVTQAPKTTQPTPHIAVSQLYVENGYNRTVFVTCLSFTNGEARDVRAVQFTFDFFDAFDTKVATFTGDRVGDFSPGTLIEGPHDPSLALGANREPALNCWIYTGIVGSLSSVKVRIQKVRFADGTIWSGPSPQYAFSGSFIQNDSVLHPESIQCKSFLARFTVKWEDALQNQYCKPAIEQWRKEHGMGVPASPTPSPSPR